MNRDHPITVRADGRTVICDYCRSVWAVDLDPEAAVQLAAAMNADAGTLIPAVNRARKPGAGLCHDNTDRVVVPRLVRPPDPDERPFWATVAWGAVASVWALGQAPGALAKGTFRTVRAFFWPIAAVVGIVLVLSMGAPDIGSAIAGFLVNAVLCLVVVALVGGLAVLALKEFGHRARVTDEDDATVVKPVKVGSKDSGVE